uniref:Family with sequence similarity 107 member B n=2 Tax=Cyprinus carpio TaxID=7962 RepID=A0A8C1F2Y0_CYPCA
MMHGLPCSALQYCFGGPPDVSADSAPYLDPEISKTGPDRVMGLTVLTQPGPINPVRTDSQPSFSCVSIQTKTNGTNFITKELGSENQDTLHSYPSSEGLSEEDDAQDKSPVVDTKRPHIPRPSIIRPQKEHPIQDSLPVRTDHTEPEDGPLSGLDQTDIPEGLSRARSIMAEPDYMDGDTDELVKPKKLLNPVKSSRDHQDLQRELLMNQKRGLAPQNKPELQKVMEKRKRDQVLKTQKEEQEAHKKKSDLEIELMKRRETLEQLELEQHKNEEEQENTPEFVKMKSNLRRTKQEVDGQERAT